MAGTPIYFGTFNLNDGTNYFVIERPTGTAQINQSTTNIARMEGVKIHGEWTGPRTIPMKIKVIGTTRSDLENKLDILYLALDQRQQHLLLHSNDGRYFVADALYQEAHLGIGDIIRAEVGVTFTCQNPYALAASPSTYTTGNQFFVVGSGGATVLSLSATGGGNKFCRPLISLYNRKNPLNTTLATALTSGNTYTQITVPSLAAPLWHRDTITLTSGAHTQNLTVATDANIGDSTIYVSSFTANFSYPIGSPVTNVIYWTDVVLQQQTDNQYLGFNGSNLVNAINAHIDIDCDPVNLNGWRIIDSTNPSVNLQPNGTFLTLNPGVTPYTLAITSPSLAVCEMKLQWTSRWLS